MKKIKQYREIRDKLRDKKNIFWSKLLDIEKKDINLDIKNIKRVLFVRIDGKIGDYIVSSFAFRELKKNNPNLVIDIVGDNSMKEILKLNPNIDNYYVINKKSYIELFKIVKILKKNNYDIVFDPSDGVKPKQIYFLKSINSKINIGYNKKEYGVYNKKIEKNNDKMSNIYKKMLEIINVENIDTSYDIPFCKKSEENIGKYISENKIKDLIVVNFFGASKRRKINKENALKLLNNIQEKYKNSSIIILDSPNDKEEISKILNEIKGENIYFYNNSKTILDVISIIKRSSLVISPDTSIVHIAEGLNKKIIAFYKNDKENIEKWGINNNDNNNKIVIYDKDINDLNYRNINL